MTLATTWAQSQASALLSRRATQVTWMHTPSFVHHVATVMRRKGVTGEDSREEQYLIDNVARYLTDHWASAERRMVLSRPALASIYSAAASLRGETLPPMLPHDLPTPRGLVLLPRPVRALFEDQELPFSALSWGPCYAAPGVPGVLLAAWTSRADDVNGSIDVLLRSSTETAKKHEALAEGLRYAAQQDEEEHVKDRMLRAARQHDRSAADARSRPSQEWTGDYFLREITPLPFGYEFRASEEEQGNHRERDQQTVSPGSPDPYGKGLTTRLLYTLWGLMEQGLLTSDLVALRPKVERKYSKKKMPYAVHAIQAPPALPSTEDLVTVSRVRAVDEQTPGMAREQFRWDLITPLGGRVVV